jgi:hypothetical protein
MMALSEANLTETIPSFHVTGQEPLGFWNIGEALHWRATSQRPTTSVCKFRRPVDGR